MVMCTFCTPAGARDRIIAAAKLCGASSITRGEAYPGWAPNPSSPLLQLTKETYKQALGREPKVSAGLRGRSWLCLNCPIIVFKADAWDSHDAACRQH
jgi:di/tripeptidase